MELAYPGGRLGLLDRDLGRGHNPEQIEQEISVVFSSSCIRDQVSVESMLRMIHTQSGTAAAARCFEHNSFELQKILAHPQASPWTLRRFSHSPRRHRSQPSSA